MTKDNAHFPTLYATLTNSIIAEIPVLNRVPSTSSVTWKLNHHLVKGDTVSAKHNFSMTFILSNITHQMGYLCGIRIYLPRNPKVNLNDHDIIVLLIFLSIFQMAGKLSNILNNT